MRRFASIPLLILILLSFELITFAQSSQKASRPEQGEKLKWLSWNEGYPKAKETGKILLIDMYTDWCGWCKKMDRDTYSKKEVIDLINEHFIPVKFNPELVRCNK